MWWVVNADISHPAATMIYQVFCQNMAFPAIWELRYCPPDGGAAGRLWRSFEAGNTYKRTVWKAKHLKQESVKLSWYNERQVMYFTLRMHLSVLITKLSYLRSESQVIWAPVRKRKGAERTKPRKKGQLPRKLSDRWGQEAQTHLFEPAWLALNEGGPEGPSARRGLEKNEEDRSVPLQCSTSCIAWALASVRSHKGKPLMRLPCSVEA